jgi:hypothetical protein
MPADRSAVLPGVKVHGIFAFHDKVTQLRKALLGGFRNFVNACLVGCNLLLSRCDEIKRRRAAQFGTNSVSVEALERGRSCLPS